MIVIVLMVRLDKKDPPYTLSNKGEQQGTTSHNVCIVELSVLQAARRGMNLSPFVSSNSQSSENICINTDTT